LEINKMKMIIYKKDDGGVAIVIPTNEGLEKLGGIDNLAKRDVPTGKKYKIVDESEILSDRTFRNAWEIDESELTDGVGD
tara:strand:+ start:461 stop:700 length:240 start_codon:yes stop_codon:yes gene_type:complete